MPELKRVNEDNKMTEAVTERSDLLRRKNLEEGLRFRNVLSVTGLALLIGVVVMTKLISNKSGLRGSITAPAASISSYSMLSASPNMGAQRSSYKCDDILLGAWVETCFFAANPDGVFPGMQGVMSYPIIISRASEGGVLLYGYSIREPFFGGLDYWELGSGSPSRIKSPTAKLNCAAHFDSELKISGQEEWKDSGEYYWNRITDDKIVAGGNGAACQFRRLYGNECREVRANAIDRFADIGKMISLPSEQELCG